MKMPDQTPAREIVLNGIAASPGIAIGRVYLFTKEIPRVEQRTIEAVNVEPEIERLTRAIEKASRELNKILLFARQKVGDAKARVFEAQIMILEDRVLLDAVVNRIRRERKNAEFIVSDEIGKYAHLMM